MKCIKCSREMQWAATRGVWWCNDCREYQPGPSPDKELELLAANSAVRTSRWLGYGGLALLFLGVPTCGYVTRSGTVAGILGFVAVGMIIVGAIMGQVARAKQGRIV